MFKIKNKFFGYFIIIITFIIIFSNGKKIKEALTGTPAKRPTAPAGIVGCDLCKQCWPAPKTCLLPGEKIIATGAWSSPSIPLNCWSTRETRGHRKEREQREQRQRGSTGKTYKI